MDDLTISNRPLEDLERVGLAAREALTDSMIERLTVTGANGLEILDRLNDEDTRAAVHALIDGLTELHRLGAIETLLDAVRLLHSAKEAVTDNMVERLFTFFEQMITTVGNEPMGELAENMRNALEEAADEEGKRPPRGGLLATLSLLSRPQTQRSLFFLLNFTNKLHDRILGH
jgi:uncharacterized protein YjgD (DUF1641 family)